MRSNQASRAGGDHRRGLGRLGQAGEVSQIGRKQRGADRLPSAAARRACLHPGGTAPAEIGFEQRSQRQDAEKCGSFPAGRVNTGKNRIRAASRSRSRQENTFRANT
jgi:hypothetical protein